MTRLPLAYGFRITFHLWALLGTQQWVSSGLHRHIGKGSYGLMLHFVFSGVIWRWGMELEARWLYPAISWPPSPSNAVFLLKTSAMYFVLFYFLSLFIYLFLAVLGLRCCARAFSSCGKRASLCCGAQASHCGGFSCCGARALGMRAQ